MSHKFKIKQSVRMLRPAFSDARAVDGANFEITRLMPASASGEYSYRIKAPGSAERAVLESDIVANAESIWQSVWA